MICIGYSLKLKRKKENYYWFHLFLTFLTIASLLYKFSSQLLTILLKLIRTIALYCIVLLDVIEYNGLYVLNSGLSGSIKFIGAKGRSTTDPVWSDLFE